MFLIGMLGSIFIIVSLGIFSLHAYYLINGKRMRGKVIAIEKYQSLSGQTHDQVERTYYRPLYEYYFSGEKIWFAGAGSNVIEQEIGAPIEIRVLGRGPEFCSPKTNLYLIIATFFSIFGAIAIGISWREFPTWESRLTPIFFTLILLLISTLFLKRKGLLQTVIDGLIKQSRLETMETLKEREVYWNNAEINQIKRKHAKLAVIVSSIFLITSAGLTLYLWSRIPTELTEQSFQQQLETPEFVGFLISVAFTLISLGSYIHSLGRR